MVFMKGLKDEEIERAQRGLVIRGWLAAVGLALALFVYGMFAYLVIGDKGPPDWDFGTVPDIPGQSIYSTTPGIRGPRAMLEPQHVQGKPSLADSDVSKGQK